MAGRLLIALGAFIVATVTGYFAILFGWIAYTEMAGVFDREGAMIMGIAFFFAPIGGLLLGLAAAIVAYRLMSRRTKRRGDATKVVPRIAYQPEPKW